MMPAILRFARYRSLGHFSQILEPLSLRAKTKIKAKYMLADAGAKSLGRSLSSIAKLRYKFPLGLSQLFALLPIPKLCESAMMAHGGDFFSYFISLISLV